MAYAAAVTRGLRAVAARGHVAPAAAAVLRRVEEDVGAALIGAAARARDLAGDERIGGRVDDGEHEPGERVADADERARVAAVRALLDPARDRAAAEDPVDLGESDRIL